MCVRESVWMGSREREKGVLGTERLITKPMEEWTKRKNRANKENEKKEANDIKTGFVLYGVWLKEHNTLTCSFKNQLNPIIFRWDFCLNVFFFFLFFRTPPSSYPRITRLPLQVYDSLSIHVAAVVLCVKKLKIGCRLLMMTSDGYFFIT